MPTLRLPRPPHPSRLRRAGAHGTDVAPGPGRRPRLRRWLRRVALGCAVLWAAVTVASLAYNGFTSGRAAPPPGLSYVQAGDVRTRYQEWGTAGTPVVLVHGAFETVDTWSRLAPLLARDHRVYALDLTGDGYSQRRGPYTVDHFTRQLLGFLDAMRLSGRGAARPLLVGHSSGAAVVTEAALRAPGRIGGVMLLDGDALDTGAGPPSALKYVLVDPYRTSLLRLGLSTDAVIRGLYDAQCGPGCPPLDGAGVDQWRRPLQVAGAEGALWSMLGAGVPGLPAARVALLAAVPIPKAVVFGASDDVFSRQSPEQTARRVGAPAPTLIPGARHLTMISNPGAVATAVERLAGRVGQEAPADGGHGPLSP
ncbi:alpha/beta fold hydrolase [Actinacidiphila rubida]|uniref:Pimeloyl-ACP methyl ester carboxylesterase n=1 Tax=Actinacidiphila rubida TaxID=310780 RepID=A0A1H8UV28_9ACTN|nr:alpha/beta hydrolase [Actinacidiphila rubida]SEP07011.1 Pimeloyl-ACP methyl ester carboxylesterase [Actinacidiphila rubida]